DALDPGGSPRGGRLRGRRMTFMSQQPDTWTVGGKTFSSRLIVGTGKYKSIEETREAIARSGAEVVTVALRRLPLDRKEPSVLDAIDRSRLLLLPNTAGCYTAEDAIRTCRLARELGMAEMV